MFEFYKTYLNTTGNTQRTYHFHMEKYTPNKQMMLGIFLG